MLERGRTARWLGRREGASAQLALPGADWLLAGAGFLLTAALIFPASAWTERFVVWKEFDNLYFQADCSLVYSNMTDFASNHYRTGMHPLFSLVMFPLVAGLRGAADLSSMNAVRVLLAANAGLLAGASYLVQRRLGLPPVGAATFAAMHVFCAATLFFGTVPETFAFGGTSMVVMLAILALVPGPPVPALVVGNLVTMSMTLTNWMMGLYATSSVLWGHWRRILGVALLSLAILAALGTASRLTFPSAAYPGDFRRYLAWVRLPLASDVRSFFLHSVVMPEPVFRARADGLLEVVAEPAEAGTGSAVGGIAVAGWLALLSLGALVALLRQRDRVTTVVLLTVGSQLALHAFFADGPFLFAAHFAPLLVLVAAHAALVDRFRAPVLCLAAATVALLAYNNLVVFDRMLLRLENEVLPSLERQGTPASPAALALARRER